MMECKSLPGAALAISFGSAGSAGAQTYPSRPITMVVPFPAGGSTDTIARIMAEAMRAPLGQPIVIENSAARRAISATGRVAHAAPDGYTLVLGSWPTHVLNAGIFTLPYDPVARFRTGRPGRGAAALTSRCGRTFRRTRLPN